MGSWDGAEISELCGVYLLNRLTDKNGPFEKSAVGLYQDDSLGVAKGTDRTRNQIRKRIEAIFNKEGLKITSDINMTETDFLDVKLNLVTHEHRPYRKPGDVPTYIHVLSNHPPAIIKEVPKMVEKCLSKLSSNEKIFQEEIEIYQKAIDDSGYKTKLSYNPNATVKQKSRKRKITWFNPPFNLDVQTNIAAKFLKMVTCYFPKDHPLHKIFNRHTLKVNYSTTRNINKHISKHNNTVISKNKPEKEKKLCNCRVPANCPFSGECQVGPLVYQADVQTNTSKKSYNGSTGRTFKERYTTHKQSFTNRNANSTALSSYIWSLKDSKHEHEITWSIKAKSGVYMPGAKYCDVCLTEKTHIMLGNPKESLNVRTEILNKCRHKGKFTLAKI